MNEALGHCPLCSSLLTRDGETLVCPNGNFAVPEARWNAIWDFYDSILRSQKKGSVNSVFSETLLKDLRAENLKP